ncbi:transcription-repair coupling factor [Suipraeoptans intestinalis]|uniref:transcription-repair coupling factor n=1 Tax=Suipraeoptans intestinalis TaxID=2606628 RepID=UPI0023F3299C|nr:transcription-repair coupling factor [Suipraeoptans intestinalis]MDD7769646.1 transcription-repair coupling factor [Suipraeoptans intestinalis]
MKALTEPLAELTQLEEVWQQTKKKPGMLYVSGCVRSQKTHMMYKMGDGFLYKVIACSGEDRAKEIYEEYRSLDREVYLYPAKDFLFHHADVRSKELTRERMEVLQKLGNREGMTVILTFDGFMDGLAPLEEMKQQVIRIREGESLLLEEVETRLSGLGYERAAQVDTLGQFAIRGGILDVFPLTMADPVRIELWGDEVDCIRTFDTESQRSLERLKEAEIGAATETPDKDYKKVSFLQYFSPEETCLFLDDPIRLLEKGELIQQEFLEAAKRRKEAGVEMEEELLLYGANEVVRQMNRFSMVGFAALERRCKGFHRKESCSLQAVGVTSYNGSFDALTRDLKRWKREGYRSILFSVSRTRAKRLAEDLRDCQINSFYTEDIERNVNPGELMVTCGYVASGYEYPKIRLAVVTESDIFGKKQKRKQKKQEGKPRLNFLDLHVGDYVVHENHGLGIYRGIEKIEVEKISRDYLKIAYAQGGNLYIPVTQLDLLQKYAGADAKTPKLNTLGTREWEKTKTRVKGAVAEIAKELVQLYAQRQQEEGFVYGEDTVWQKEFEELFPYEETQDQLAAIQAVKEDMQSRKIMDRLICGDVGYGKTEIAIRAAFKAVQENRQVVYLVPTTILAQQHYNNFVQRMKNFPVRVDLMCRFRTPAQQKKTAEDVKKGLVDIVVGTHRVLSDDMTFKNLGLMIVDEEQRFGVRHKEKIKQMKKNVDVLTLTATPIPRTLHMSLIGIRDMSVLEEAPGERLPIQTYVMEYNEELIREAVERECQRNGQVYYVYNRIEQIASVAARIQKLAPDVRVAYAHGRMPEHKLEKIMYSFVNREIDVLVSTTIIETGLDIPNVNTMIIHDADQLGLSQLYQLRGRVGRSSRMAYAFLLYRRDKLLKEVAEKRLAAIREFTQLGAGFKIAMRDLEIRGAGNLLGAAQHGHMEAVGYDLYCKMLNLAVQEQKGTGEAETFQVTLDVAVDAYIPDTYVEDTGQKLELYKRIASIENTEEKEEMIDELADRYGDLPKKVETLLEVAVLKGMAKEVYVTAIEQKGDAYHFLLYQKARFQVEKIPEFLETFRGDLQFKTDGKGSRLIYRRRNRAAEEEQPVEILKKVLNEMKGLLEA